MSMAALPDSELLRRYARDKSEAAFAELVRRHLDQVYAGALRRLGGDTHLAEDATQRVFTAVARNATTLAEHRTLIGWLYTTTRFAAAEIVRSEQRRQVREHEAYLMQELTSEPTQAEWERLRPVLDGVLDELAARDRDALLLRFFEGRAFRDIRSSSGRPTTQPGCAWNARSTKPGRYSRGVA